MLRIRQAAPIALLAAALTTVLGVTPAGATTRASHRHTGLKTAVFATGNSAMSQPDDIARLGRDIFVAWQNQVGPDGSPSPAGALDSTLVEYRPDGTVVQQWSLPGHVDGIAGDRYLHELIVTTNEDANSSLVTVDPSSPAGSQVTHYAYQPTPLPHGGGTDAISIVGRDILISASNPSNPSGPAVYRVTLSGTTADTTPLFFDNSEATAANVDAPNRGSQVQLALTDPDSNEVVPGSSPRFRHDFVLDSQGDQQQIYVRRASGASPQLSVLNLSQSIDDTAWVTNDDGTLYVSDGADNEVFTVTGEFHPGTAYVAVTPSSANTPVNTPNYLGQLNMWTGQVSSVLTSIQAKGLLFVP